MFCSLHCISLHIRSINSVMSYRRTNSNLNTFVTEQRQSGFDDESCTKKERLPRCHQYVIDPSESTKKYTWTKQIFLQRSSALCVSIDVANEC